MTEFARFPELVQRFVLWLEPTGGQTVARRNARSSLVLDIRRRTERAEAERALPAGPIDHAQLAVG